MTFKLEFVVVESNFDYYADMFVETKRLTQARRTAEWHQETLKQFRAVMGEDWPPQPRHLLAFFKELKSRKLAEYTQNNYWRSVRAWLNWLHYNGIVDENPAERIRGPKAPKQLPKAPPQSAISELLATIAQHLDNWHAVRDLAIFSLALDTGARLNELATLRLSQVDLEYQEITLNGTKVNAQRIVEYDDSVAKDLVRWWKWRAKLEPPPDLDRLWISNYQGKGLRPLTDWGIRLRLKYWQKKAGVKPFNFHAFRHAYAVYSLRNRADLLDIKEQMGHSSIKTTAIYLEVVDEGRKERHRKTSPRKSLFFDAEPGAEEAPSDDQPSEKPSL
jgi:integrase/recombinase XerC